METCYWTCENEISQNAILNHESDVDELNHCVVNESATDLLNSMAMAGGFSTPVDHYCHELDNASFGAFDDYFFAPAGKGHVDESILMSKGVKKDHRIPKMDQPLPVVPTIKTEYLNPYQNRYSCNMPGQNRLGFRSDLSLETAFSPTSDLGSSCSASPAVDLDSSDSSLECGVDTGFEVYHELIMRHLIQDIQGTCARLNIPKDPKLWTPSDSNAWLMDMSTQYNLSQVPYEKLSVDGASLCSMSLGQFVQCFPNGGETVHAQLQIWNSANEYCTRQNSVNSNPVMISVNNDEPGLNNLNDEQQQQFVQMNPGSVIQRLRNTADDGPSAYGYQPPFLVHQHHQEQFLNNAQLGPSYGMGAILPSPGSCSESGMSIEGDYGSLNASNANMDPSGRHNGSSNIHLWQFLRELLEQQEKYGQCVRWIDHSAGIFKIEDSHTLARLWGKRKNRPAMNYDKLSRSLRQYYKKNILKKTTRSQRLVYQFMHPYHVC